MLKIAIAPAGAVRFLLACTISVLAACGGGGSSSSLVGGVLPSAAGPVSLGGSAVKGPLTNARVVAYAFDSSQPNFQGSVLGTGATDSQAAISGLSIPRDHSGGIVIEVSATSETLDVVTNAAPVITTMRTYIAPGELTASVYPSPLTSVAFELAAMRADEATGGFTGNGDSTVSDTEMTAAFAAASRRVVSSLGFGLGTSVNINTTPPLITGQTVDRDAQSRVAAIRTAIEGLSAVAVKLQEQARSNNAASQVTTNQLLNGLARDLADGEIDGLESGNAIDSFEDAGNIGATVTTDPSSLMIPGTNISIVDVEQVLVSEKEQTGADTDTQDLEDGSAGADARPAKTSADSDEDGLADTGDNCPFDANADQENFDQDEQGDACDRDDDNDGTDDSIDAFPKDASEQRDTDGDNIGDQGDNCPLVANADQTNTDGEADGGDACDDDNDNDGVNDVDDAFPEDANEQVDTDNDGVGNNEDQDDDGDGVPDTQDAFPEDASESSDGDGDGVGDNGDAFPDNSEESSDRDADGIGDNSDNCPDNPNTEQADEDKDGIGDACDTSVDFTLWGQFNWDEANWQ